MRPDFTEFARQKLVNYAIAVTNICIYFPYFFSVKPLLKTLFRPWKNLVSPRSTAHESLNSWASRLSFNWISSFIGFVLRIAIICMYIFVQSLLVILLPGISILYILTVPMQFVFSQFGSTDEEKKDQLRENFISDHMLDQKNKKAVNDWFEWYYGTYIKHSSWWLLKNLLNIPPLARDWSFGFTPTLDEYSEELTLMQPHYKNLIDRVDEIGQIEQILSKSEEHNCVIVGDEGIGKHAIVEGLAKKMYEGKSTQSLSFKRLLKLDMAKIISKSTDFSQREEIMTALFKEAASAGNILLLINDFDRYTSEGSNRIDLSTSMNPFAKSSQLQIIGITTPFAYQKYVIKNEKISSLFEKVSVSEISKESAMQILLTATPSFEKRFSISIPYETIAEVITKSDRYVTAIPFPEKAIDLLDETCVYATETKKVEIVRPEMVDAVLTKKTHSPVQLDDTIKNRLLNLELNLKKRIVAQDESISTIAKALRKSFVSMSSRKKPLATLLFLGPTGVGKTETAKAVSDIFFNSNSSLIRFDMSLYQSKNDIPNLIGNQDSGNPGLLTSAINEHSYGVLLIDEIEKADRDLLNIFLTILDEGYFSDGFGKRVDCRNLIVIATSNAGADYINLLLTKGKTIDTNAFINYIIEQKLFLPEFLNRFDGVIVYKPLYEKALTEIAQKMIFDIITNIQKEYGVVISATPKFIAMIIKKGFDPRFGARNMARTIRDKMEDKIAKLVLENKVKKGDTIKF